MNTMERLGAMLLKFAKTQPRAAIGILALLFFFGACAVSEPASPHKQTSVSASVVSRPVAPPNAPLGMPLTVAGVTVTPRADNLAFTRQTYGDDLELGINVSVVGVTTSFDVATYSVGLVLYTSNGDELHPGYPLVLTMPQIASTVKTDAEGWLFFRIKPGPQPTELRYIDTKTSRSSSAPPLAIWTMPPALPEPAAAPPPPTTEYAPGGGSGSVSGDVDVNLPNPHVPHKPSICRHTRWC